jgi:hypothetical protein
MAWSEQYQDEITAPATLPFVPGQNVTGFGSEVPDELVTAGYSNAIVFYDSSWDPAAATPKVKFRFIAAKAGSFVIGYGFCVNPSVSQTAVVVAGVELQEPADPYPGVVINGATGAAIAALYEYVVGANREGAIILGSTDTINGSEITLDPDFVTIFSNPGHIQRLALAQFSTSCYVGLHDIQLLKVYSETNRIRVAPDGYFVRDTAWRAFTLFNGWVGHATYVPQYRNMPDGTTMFKGVVTKPTNPVNGQQWGSIVAGTRPSHDVRFSCPPMLRIANDAQTVNIQTNGACIIYDPPALTGDINLDGIRFHTSGL